MSTRPSTNPLSVTAHPLMTRRERERLSYRAGGGVGRGMQVQEVHPAISTLHHAVEFGATTTLKNKCLGCQGDRPDLRTLSTLSLIPTNSASAFSFLFIYLF